MKIRDAGATLIIFAVLCALVFGTAEIVLDDEPKQEQGEEL